MNAWQSIAALGLACGMVMFCVANKTCTGDPNAFAHVVQLAGTIIGGVFGLSVGLAANRNPAPPPPVQVQYIPPPQQPPRA